MWRGQGNDITVPRAAPSRAGEGPLLLLLHHSLHSLVRNVTNCVDSLTVAGLTVDSFSNDLQRQKLEALAGPV